MNRGTTRITSMFVCALLVLVIAISTVCTFVGHSVHASIPPPQPTICIHFSADMSRDLAEKLIDYAAELGAKYIRLLCYSIERSLTIW